MRKLKIMTVLLVGIIGFFIFSLTIKASTELKVSIDIEKDRIEFKNEEVIYSRKSMKCYELKTEEEEILAHHLYSYDEAYGIILYKSYIGEQYTLEGYVVVEEGIKTCLQKISKEEYEYLIKDAEEVIDTTELGNKLKRKQGRFEAYHTYVLDNPIREEEIESYALERHGKSIESMTKTDEYIKGYYPSYESSSPYIRTYTDNIINIVPEEWFFKEGSYGYVGKEYAVAVTTKPAKSHDYDNDCMLANVGVFDIDVALPYLYQMNDSGLKKYPGYTHMSNKIKFDIKPIINMSYYGYEKKNFRSEYWNRKFDPSEERTVVAKKESSNTIFIAPKSMGFLAEDSNSIYPNKMKILKLSYELNANDRLNELLEQIELQGYAFTSLISMTETLIRLGIIHDPTFPNSKLGISKLLINAVANGIKISQGAGEDILKENLEKEKVDLDNNIKRLNFQKTFEETYDDNKYSSYIFSHPSFTDVFKNKLLNKYSHQYSISFKYNVGPFPNYFYDLYLSGIFDFYDNYQFELKNIESNQIYESLNLQIDCIDYKEEQAGSYDAYDGTKLTTNLSSTKLSSTMIVMAKYTGLTEIKLSSSRAVIADVYDEVGNLIQSNITSYSYNSSLLVRLEEGKKYFIYMKYSYNATGDITLKFTKMTETYLTLQTTYATHNIRGSDNNVTYFLFDLGVGGLYSFYTRVEDDTTIRVYDENLRILGESFDPNADWNEEEPDLNAQCYINSVGGNRKVIVGVYRNNPVEYHLYTNYFQAYD